MPRFSCAQCGTALQTNDARGGNRLSCPKCGAAVEIPKIAAVVVESDQAPPVRQPAAGPGTLTAKETANPEPGVEQSEKQEASAAGEEEFQAARGRAALWFFLGVCVGAFPSLAILLYVVLTMPKAPGPVAGPRPSSAASSPSRDQPTRGAVAHPASGGQDRADIERIPPSHQFIPPELRQTGSPAPADRSRAGGTQKKEEEYETGKRPLRRIAVEDEKADEEDVRIPARKADHKSP